MSPMIMSSGLDRQYLAFAKGAERYLFVFDSSTVEDCVAAIARFAGDPEQNFTWHDATYLCRRIREREQNRKLPARDARGL